MIALKEGKNGRQQVLNAVLLKNEELAYRSQPLSQYRAALDEK